MSNGTLELVLISAGALVALLAFVFGIWIGLGSPGLYDKYEQTGKAPRQSPWRWLLAGRQRARSSRFDAVVREEEEDGEPELDPNRSRPSFSRGRRFRR
ncbi:hypothetical protein [Candidatus Palauibacter sp.]|uniref:hypothetical protein n=1 Tax=Candidatus Palauibacter sp. TaxID=3101350 RepID=UPI003AF2557F